MNAIQRRCWVMGLKKGDAFKWKGTPFKIEATRHCDEFYCNDLGKDKYFKECDHFRLRCIATNLGHTLVICCREIIEDAK